MSTTRKPTLVEEVSARSSFATGHLTVRKGLRLPSNHDIVKRHPELFEKAPERPPTSTFAAVTGFATHGRVFAEGTEIRDDDPLVRAVEHLFVPSTWSVEERAAHAEFQRSQRTAPTRREQSREAAEKRNAARRASIERRVVAARGDLASAELELERLA
jgi:hypothetical protein